jgi:hypothetical protein
MPNAGCYVYTLPKLLIENILYPDEETVKYSIIFMHTCKIWYLVMSYEYNQKVFENMAMRGTQSGLLLRVFP